MAFAITSLRASPSSKAPAPLSEFQIRQGLLKEELALLKRSEEHTSELQSHSDLVCRLLLEKKKKHKTSKDVVTAKITTPRTRPNTVYASEQRQHSHRMQYTWHHTTAKGCYHVSMVVIYLHN